MLTALILAALALRGGLPGLISLAAAVVIFPIGRGTIVDGVSRQVTRWWGWVHKPVFTKSYDFSSFSAIRIDKKLGPKSGKPNVGRSVSRPLYLIASTGRSIFLITCVWVVGARGLAQEIARIMRIPMDDRFPHDKDTVE